MLGIVCVICLTLSLIAGLVYLSIKVKAEQKELMTKDICNTIEKIVIAVKGK